MIYYIGTFSKPSKNKKIHNFIKDFSYIIKEHKQMLLSGNNTKFAAISKKLHVHIVNRHEKVF